MVSKLTVTIATGMVALLLCSAGGVMGASMILNEYNAVRSDMLLKDGGVDPYFGAVLGNGGDWMEFVVIQDHLDIRGWYITTSQAGATDATIVLPDLEAFANLRAGTILTIAENVASDFSYNPLYDGVNQNLGDWWINYQASFSAGDSTHNNFQATIYDAVDNLIYGPCGEGISPLSGIGNDEIFKYEATPTSSTAANAPEYKDGTSSTFGLPNLWSNGTITQDLMGLRQCAAVPEPASILALAAGMGSALLGFRRKRGR